MCTRSATILLSLVALLFWAAPAQAGAPLPALRALSQIGYGQASARWARAMLSEGGLGRLRRAVGGRAWVMPHRRSWTIVNGYPLVQTERLDELRYRVDEGVRLDTIMERYRVGIEELGAWNPSLDLFGIEAGDELIVWRREHASAGFAVGSPNRGRLRFGEPLPRAEKYRILYEHRAFGTYYTVSELKRVFEAYAEAHPEADPVMIGDISFRRGRRIEPHLSHQSGRDVDITYPRSTPTRSYRRFQYIGRRDLDAAGALWLVRELVAGGLVEVIFIDAWVQRALYAEAARQGAPKAWLEAVFQYPRYAGKREAIVRRSKGHDDHMHVRFHCQPTDPGCEPSGGDELE